MAFQRWTAVSGMAQGMSNRSGCSGCHAAFFTGEWCIRTVATVFVTSDQIQIVVGIKSFVVASKVPSQLNLIIEIPCVG